MCDAHTTLQRALEARGGAWAAGGGSAAAVAARKQRAAALRELVPTLIAQRHGARAPAAPAGESFHLAAALRARRAAMSEAAAERGFAVTLERRLDGPAQA